MVFCFLISLTFTQGFLHTQFLEESGVFSFLKIPFRPVLLDGLLFSSDMTHFLTRDQTHNLGTRDDARIK